MTIRALIPAVVERLEPAAVPRSELMVPVPVQA